MNTGIKAPEGMGIVVETADIQNCNTKTGSRKNPARSQQAFMLFYTSRQHQQHEARQKGRYLHDEEEEEDDKDADVRMQPCGRATEARGSGGP